MKGQSESDRAALARVPKEMAVKQFEAARLNVLKEVFTKEQLKQIDAYCKRHRTHRAIVIDDIIEAGIEARGIASKGNAAATGRVRERQAARQAITNRLLRAILSIGSDVNWREHLNENLTFRYIEPAPPPPPKHDREVLMAMPNGQLCYTDDGGIVDFRDVIRRHCERERERAQYE
jgi:hypothetical protein